MTALVTNATMISPTSQTFIGNQQLEVVSAKSTSINSFLVQFSKPLNAPDIIPSNFTMSTALGNVVSAVLNPSDNTQVTITSSQIQGVGFYTVVASTKIHVNGSIETLAPNPYDRATFLGSGGAVLSVADGPLFTDPFVDGSTFSFTFTYQGQVYIGPNDSTSAVFRFLPDASNPTEATFSTLAPSGGPFANFGANITRPATTVAVPGATRWYVTPNTFLAPYIGAAALHVAITGCANAGNNQSLTGTSGLPGSGANIIIDPNLYYVQFGGAGVASSTETCQVHTAHRPFVHRFRPVHLPRGNLCRR